MGFLAPTSVCVHTTAPPPTRLRARGKRLAEQLRRKGVAKMNYPHHTVARSGSSPKRHIPRSTNVRPHRAVGGDDVQPGEVRAIEYEIMDKEQATRNGLTGASLAAGDLQSMPELGVLRCVDHQGK